MGCNQITKKRFVFHIHLTSFNPLEASFRLGRRQKIDYSLAGKFLVLFRQSVTAFRQGVGQKDHFVCRVIEQDSNVAMPISPYCFIPFCDFAKKRIKSFMNRLAVSKLVKGLSKLRQLHEMRQAFDRCFPRHSPLGKPPQTHFATQDLPSLWCICFFNRLLESMVPGQPDCGGVKPFTSAG